MVSKKENEVTVVRVTRKEYELSNGDVFEHPIELDETPTLSEFKKYYHYWKMRFSKDIQEE
jgi:hypothetical protein